VSARFRVGVTRDIVSADERPVYDLSPLDALPGVDWELLATDADELTAADVAGYDAIVLFHPYVGAATLSGDAPPLLVARLGVGYDTVDVEACTERGVLLTITPDSIRRPMASGAVAFVLALAHRLAAMDRHVRGGGWDRFAHVGTGLTGRVLGLVGLGNVGREIAVLAAPFGLDVIAADPYTDEAPPGVRLVELEELLASADFVVVACPLTEETRHLLDARRLALMRPTAYLVNVARGPIVDQAALVDALETGGIAGAALDVFEREPIEPDDPLLRLDNLLLAPHAVGLTDELFRLGGASVARAVAAVAEGRIPEYVVNRDALEHPRLRERLRP
jgi:phosphoglycerate dehydrogenase-like enzyme